MNTNNNIYTVIYTTIVVVMVAAILAFVSQKLGPMQADNEKAETVSQILAAAQFGEDLGSNANILSTYKENIEQSILIDGNGNQVGELDGAAAEVLSTAQLKAQNYLFRDGKMDEMKIPVYRFKNGISVIPIYGAGLWGPVWGYIALKDDLKTIAGAYFDHASETPGLGGKIKDDPAFRAAFAGKELDFADEKPFAIVKGGAPKDKKNAVDAITGASMTSRGLDGAINNWVKAYAPKLQAVPAPAEEVAEACELAPQCDSLAVCDSLKMEEPSNE